MRRKTKTYIAIFCTALIFCFGYFFTNVYSVQGNKIVHVHAGNLNLRAEKVSDAKSMEKGLGGRKNLCDKCAMLFSFPKEGVYAFWMNGMLFPLDIIWTKEGKIVYMEKNVQAAFEGTLVPNEAADAVIETNAGTVDANGIQLGDQIVVN